MENNGNNGNQNRRSDMNSHLRRLHNALAPVVSVENRWKLEGFASHLENCNHANHVANSWAKHRNDFGRESPLARAYCLAALRDLGYSEERALSAMKRAREHRIGLEIKAESAPTSEIPVEPGASNEN